MSLDEWGGVPEGEVDDGAVDFYCCCFVIEDGGDVLGGEGVVDVAA